MKRQSLRLRSPPLSSTSARPIIERERDTPFPLTDWARLQLFGVNHALDKHDTKFRAARLDSLS